MKFSVIRKISQILSISASNTYSTKGYFECLKVLAFADKLSIKIQNRFLCGNKLSIYLSKYVSATAIY